MRVRLDGFFADRLLRSVVMADLTPAQRLIVGGRPDASGRHYGAARRSRSLVRYALSEPALSGPALAASSVRVVNSFACVWSAAI
ncbi:hypothetical protein Mnod_5938 [Methylobacterium nodulans ORS 2060]|uniref:Uncharacterized protein n=1 Tax=Methylobacterium nodulans (strain LMG 21967 / CNCM I-2342 / ORS 2060) TaxID=460265 RepID=B8ISW7_METNO|nr:hypothetical protein Mnod_5938 [Methylobacterium nodulans ORS 2060]